MAEGAFATKAQARAATVAEDGHSSALTSELASVGSAGRHPQNALRDTMRLAARRWNLPSPYLADVPYHNADGLGVRWVKHAFCPPHELISELFEASPAQFQHRMLGGSDRGCAEFWQRSAGLPWYGMHPCRADIERDPFAVVPLRFYGDDAQHQQGKKALVLTVSSVLARHLPAWESRLLTTVVPLDHAIPGITLGEVYKVWVWSLKALSQGTHPTHDHVGRAWPPGSLRAARAGKRLAGKFTFALAQILGDWKWLKEAFCLKEHYGARLVCHLCEAVKFGEGPPFNDFSAGADWRRTRRTHERYLAAFGRPPELTSVPGMHLSMLMPDPMHVLHLGVLQWVIAAVLLVLCEAGHWGRPTGDAKTRLAVQLRAAYACFKTWCLAHAARTSQRVFTPGMLGRGDLQTSFAEFKGKAANNRWTLLWLNDVLYDVGQPSLEAVVVWGFCDVLHLLHSVQEPQFSQREAAQFSRSCLMALCCYAELQRLAQASGQALWPLKPKLHQMAHIADSVAETRANPSWQWAFCDEDFNAKVMAMCRVAHPRTLTLRVAQRYMLRWRLRLSQSAE